MTMCKAPSPADTADVRLEPAASPQAVIVSERGSYTKGEHENQI